MALPEGLPVADIHTVDFYGLINDDQLESEKLLNASKEDGFFYLSFNAVEHDGTMELIEKMYQLNKDLFSLPLGSKMEFDVDKLYKPIGRNFGELQGKKDGFETWVLPKNGIMGLGGQKDFSRPPVIDRYMPTLQQFGHFVQTCSRAVMDSLSKSLGLPESENFMTYHRPMAPSSDITRLLKYEAQPIEERNTVHTAHTDIGSLTFLFTAQPGLQIYNPETDAWYWVQPKDGCVIVNLGDGMTHLTNGYLRSSLHRVGPLPGKAMPTRYSFAYMLRAEDETPMTGLKSPLFPPKDCTDQQVYTSAEWLRQKYGVLRLDGRPEDNEWMMAGQKR
ncbi:oxidoreductase [Penicillium hetheringtonii]|uniref:Oxidoreductase n=1 Tax=Penicillium hetheringtonii TaxID=911720 RepID=A0AAD6GND7_9EURO|nr:oxidoreductase [Penicillium hetheringtonii]